MQFFHFFFHCLHFLCTLTLAPSIIWTLTNKKEDACAYLSDVSVYLSIGEVKYCNLMGTKKITDWAAAWKILLELVVRVFVVKSVAQLRKNLVEWTCDDDRGGGDGWRLFAALRRAAATFAAAVILPARRQDPLKWCSIHNVNKAHQAIGKPKSTAWQFFS